MVQPLEQNDPKLAEIVRRLVETYQPEQIYLFGSRARGDDGPDSDYDLMVIVPDDASPERRDGGRAYTALWGTATAADVLIWLKGAFERRSRVVASLPATVLREGKLLYAVRKLEPAFRHTAVLTDYAWRYRYPGAPADPSAEEAEKALALAREVYDAVLALLPRETHPT